MSVCFKEKKCFIMKSGIVKMMMCCCRLSLLPHSDDVLGIVPTCLPVVTPSPFLARKTFSGRDYRGLLREESKHQAELQAWDSCRDHVGSFGK